MNNERFESFICERNDVVDNSIYFFMRDLLQLPQEETENNDPFPWSMEIIGKVADAIEDALAQHGIYFCHPYWEGEENDGIPCYQGNDCYCAVCPFKNPAPEKPAWNTSFTYLYRDAANYKKQNSCIVKGRITEKQLSDILASLDDGEFFVPSKVGLPEKRFETWDENDDHIFFELDCDGIEITEAKPTIDTDIETVAKKFVQNKDKWEY